MTWVTDLVMKDPTFEEAIGTVNGLKGSEKKKGGRKEKGKEKRGLGKWQEREGETKGGSDEAEKEQSFGRDRGIAYMYKEEKG